MTVLGSTFSGFSPKAILALVRRGLKLGDMMPTSGGTVVRVVESRGGALESRPGARGRVGHAPGAFLATNEWIVAMSQHKYNVHAADAWSARTRVMADLAKTPLVDLRIEGD